MPGTQHLWSAEASNPLDTAGYEIEPDAPDGRASLSGPQPVYGHKGAKGIGGTEISPVAQNNHPQNPHDQVRHERPPTPEELMALADQMEAEQLETHNQRMGQGPAADPVLDRSMGRADSPPEWLQNYMEAAEDAPHLGEPENAYTGPTGPAMGMSFDGIDRVGARKYRSEQDRLKELRNELRHQGKR